jgi:hypothetical protein
MKDTSDTPHYEDPDEELKGNQEIKEQSGQKEEPTLHKKTTKHYEEEERVSDREEYDKISELPKKIKVGSVIREKSMIDFYCCSADNFAITWNNELQESQKKTKYENVLPFLITTFYDKVIYALICSKAENKEPFLSDNYVLKKFASHSYDEEVFLDNLNLFLK